MGGRSSSSGGNLNRAGRVSAEGQGLANISSRREVTAENPITWSELQEEMGRQGSNSGYNSNTLSSGERLAAEDRARAKISLIKGNKRIENVTITNPQDGHDLRVTLEKVTTRDYWGRSTGRQTYTMRVDDTNSGDRVYYNYGMESMRDVHEQLRRITGVTSRRSRR